MTTILLLISLLISSLLVCGLVLHWLANRLMAKKATPARTGLVLALMLFVELGAILSFVYALPEEQSAISLLAPVFLAIGVVVANVAVVAALFQLSVVRSVLVCVLLTAIMNVLAIGERFLLHHTAVRTYEANGVAMAPTLVGRHRIGKCAHCGGRLIVRPRSNSTLGPLVDENAEREAICSQCHQFSLAEMPSAKTRTADQMISAVFLEPQRWDMVVYLAPGNASPLLSRVVGLPGESVVVNEGSVYVDGQKMALPKEIAGTEYESALAPGYGTAYFIDVESPTTLGIDEYCLLGDFSKNSLDSRYVGPIRRDQILGVVTVCYWPIERWRIWR
jgi:signal peptidase I